MFCQRTSSTKTRIKTIHLQLALSPLSCQRTSSTKTRIKTNNFFHQLLFGSQRTSSTKTRIKTLYSCNVVCFVHCVREYHPLKQGLRLYSTSSELCTIGQRTSSTKTRIKTMKAHHWLILKLQVREHHPLKQGLRRVNNKVYFVDAVVREHHPLKQGLRPQRYLLTDLITWKQKSNIHYNKD